MRRLAAVIILSLAVAACTPAVADPQPQTAAPSVTTDAGATCAPATYRYGALEVQRWWNCSHNPNIDRATAVRLAAYLNATVDAQLQAYAFAVWLSRLPGTCTGPGDCPDLVRRVFADRGLADQAEAAVRVAACESGFNPRAYNGASGASGLFQHLARYWPARAAQAGYPGASPFDPVPNIVAATVMVRGSGWSAWECRP